MRLRERLIEAGAWELYTSDCEPIAPAEFCPGCGSDVERILDAFLDCLAENEWPNYEAAAEVYANQRPGIGPVTDRKRVEAIVDAAIGNRLLIPFLAEES